MTLAVAFACVFAAAALGGLGARRLGVPPVVGQMCGGVLLGPLLLGSLLPGAYETVFTADNRAVIGRLGTVAACVFLFVAAASHPDSGRTPRRDIGLLAGANACVALLGTALLIALIQGMDVARLDVAQSSFLVLVFTVCAIPVLLRIIDEKDLAGLRAARYAVAIAVATDIVVWCVVALLDGVTNGNLPRAIVGAVIMSAVLLCWPLAGRRVRRLINSAQSPLGVSLAALSCAAFGITMSELAGIDPLIGALLGGAVFGAARSGSPAPWFMRPGWFRALLTYIALPIFFGSAGLAAAPQGGAGQLVGLAAAMAVVAIAVRVVAVLGCSRWTALDRTERVTTFWLTCARGGTELALLRVGLDAGLLPSALYAPAVLMAIVTTALSGVLTPSGTGLRRVPVLTRKGTNATVPFRSME